MRDSWSAAFSSPFAWHWFPQRIYQIVAGWEDGNDAYHLRHDRLL
jgi:hypothetical protein